MGKKKKLNKMFKGFELDSKYNKKYRRIMNDLISPEEDEMISQYNKKSVIVDPKFILEGSGKTGFMLIIKDGKKEICVPVLESVMDKLGRIYEHIAFETGYVPNKVEQHPEFSADTVLKDVFNTNDPQVKLEKLSKEECRIAISALEGALKILNGELDEDTDIVDIVESEVEISGYTDELEEDE